MSKVKKALSVIGTVLTALIFLAAVAVMINIFVCRSQNRPVSFFGVSFAVVLSESMEPEIMKGDLIVFKECDYSEVSVGDNIVFVAGSGFGSLEGQNIVHSVYQITEDGIITKGKNEATNPLPDKDLVTADNLLGICTYNSAALGAIFSFMSSYGIFIIIALIAVPFIIYQIVKIVRLAKNKEE